MCGGWALVLKHAHSQSKTIVAHSQSKTIVDSRAFVFANFTVTIPAGCQPRGRSDCLPMFAFRIRASLGLTFALWAMALKLS